MDGAMSRVVFAIDSLCVAGRRESAAPELAAGVNRDRFRPEIQTSQYAVVDQNSVRKGLAPSAKG